MEAVLATMQKLDRSGDGSISMDELAHVLGQLDSAEYWTREKLQVLVESTNATKGEGRVGLEALVRGLYETVGPKAAEEFKAVREDLLRVMDSPNWDDGSYAPLLIRLAWHSSGTFCRADGTGGSNGATMRYAIEAGDPENAGLQTARQFLEPIKAKYPWVTYADLWILAAYVAIEHTGGPKIPFTGGRVDAPAEKAIAPGRLPGAERDLAEGWKVDQEGRFEGWEKLAQHVRDVFGRMGFDDREAVALISGGHVYGRCHTESSGYAGAWVENPTIFSNEYAADMVGDEWIAVTHDTKMPDGGPVPEEVRPAPGKRQYIDLTKYKGEEGDKAAVQAPDAAAYPPGRYRCASTWVNCREQPDTTSPIIGRFVQDQVLSLVSVKLFGTAVRGLTERGGWVSIIGSGGKALFERDGDLDLQRLQGPYRAIASAGAPVFPALGSVTGESRLKPGEEFVVAEVAFGQDGDQSGALLGRLAGGGWALLFSPGQGLVAELIVEGYNEHPRKPIKSQSGHQMMLVSDMVLLWDEGFRKHLQAYADDEELLRKDFGEAFRRLTELGCPWSDAPGPAKAAGAPVSNGCPFLHGSTKA